MSFTAVWLWTLVRSLLLMTLALPWCGWLVRWIRSSPPRRRGWQLGLLTLPVLFPELLTGYAYSQMTRLLITGFWTRELWFDLLLLLPAAAVFTSAPTAAHGLAFGGLNPTEQVLGRAFATQVQVIIPLADKPALLGSIRAQFAGAGLRYWITPVIEAGEVT